MTDFQEQLERSARRLRNRRNEALDVPPCPRPARRRSGPWRTAVAAAACVGVVAGWTGRGLQPAADPAVMARVDTVYVERPAGPTAGPDTARCPAKPSPQVQPRRTERAGRSRQAVEPSPIAAPLPAEAVRTLAPGEFYAYAPQAGRNVLTDSVDYALFVGG